MDASISELREIEDEQERVAIQAARYDCTPEEIVDVESELMRLELCI
jgi:hypothetical protein